MQIGWQVLKDGTEEHCVLNLRLYNMSSHAV